MATAHIIVSDVTGKRTFDLTNSDHLENDMPYPGNLGGKTGFTPEAGHCLINTATQNGVTLIGVILGADANISAVTASAVADRILLNYGFAAFTWN